MQSTRFWARRALLFALLLLAAGVLFVQAGSGTLAAPVADKYAAPQLTPCGPGGPWLEVPSQSPAYYNNILYGVAAVSGTDGWAVGESGTPSAGQTLIERWNGTAWSAVAVNIGGGLRGVDVIAPHDAWAVGFLNGSPQRTLALHWDGSSWNTVATPNIGTSSNILNAVSAVGPNDVWAVGTAGYQPIILHWDGAAWTVVPHALGGVTASLNGVHAVSANDVWAVGNLGSNTLVLHWNGTAWTQVGSPNVNTSNVLTAIHGVAADDLWAVGYSSQSSNNFHGITMHWDGTAWSLVTNPTAPGASPDTWGVYLYGVAASATDEVWAVGKNYQSGSTRTVIIRWNGTSWSQEAAPSPGYNSILRGVTTAWRGEAWAVGGGNGSSYYRALALRYTTPACPTSIPTETATDTPTPTDTPTATATPCGGGVLGDWQQVTSPNGPLNTSALYGVSAAATDDVWAVGDTGGSYSGQTLIERWNGTAWSVVTGQVGGGLRGVDVIAADDVWAVGFLNGSPVRTLTMHWNGSAWSSVPSPNVGTSTNILNAVSAVSPNDVWAVGTAGAQAVILHWDGAAWSVVANSAGANSSLNGVHAVSANDAWAVGAVGSTTLVLHWDGTTWSRVTSPNVNTSNVLTAIHGVAADDVWAVGYSSQSSNNFRGITMHWDGTAWSLVANPTGPEASPNTWGVYLYGVSAAATNEVWAVGKNYQSSLTRTVILRWDGTSWSLMASPSPGTNSILRGVAAVTRGDAWSVGSTYNYYSNYSTLIERYVTPPCPTSTPVPPTATEVPTDTPVPTATEVPPTNTHVPPTATHVPPTNTHVPPTATHVPPTSTQEPQHGCQFAILSYSACIDGTGCVSYTIPLQNTDPQPVNVDGRISMQKRGGVEIASAVIPPTWIDGRGITMVNGQICATVNPEDGPFQLVVTIQDVERVCESKTKRQPLTFCEAPRHQQSFSDVPAAHPFYTHISWLASYSFLSGYSCGGPGEPCNTTNDPYYRAWENVTRAQLVKIVVSASNWPLHRPAIQTFADVAPTHPFYSYLETAAAHGLISGYRCGGPGEACDTANRPFFRPNTPITRGQMSKVITVAWGFAPYYPATPSFTDVPASDPFYGYVEAMAYYGIAGGYSCGGPGEPCGSTNKPYFRSYRPTLRAHAAKFVGIAYGSP